MSLDQFEDWFESAARSASEDGDLVREVSLSIEFALSSLRFDGVSEDELRLELANAIRPFEVSVTLSSAAQIEELAPFLEDRPRKRSASETSPVRVMYA